MVKAKYIRSVIVIFVYLIIANMCNASDLVKIVKNLGRSEGYETDVSRHAKDFYRLNMNRNDAIKILLSELKPIREKVILIEQKAHSVEGLHIVWCIRALRFLNGCTFFTEEAKEDRYTDEDQIRILLLMQKKANKYTFFATSAIHDKIYVAPIYAQESIIKQWNDWFKKYSGQLKNENCRDAIVWYY